MAYTPTNWNTGDTITATAMNKIENGIANAGGSWDAVIRLTHADNSGPDNSTNLTPSIISGTFTGLYEKITNDGCPCVLVEYIHPWGMYYAAPMASINTVNSTEIALTIYGYSVTAGANALIGTLHWNNSDILSFE